MPDDRSTGPYLYLPIEIASRELRGKLLLTYFAVRMGYEAVIGWKRLMNRNLRHMPTGTVLFKTLTANDGNVMARARAAGHRVAAIDEEVPGLISTQEKLRWVLPESVAACDLLFAVGQDHLEALNTHFPEYAERYRVVGNPRWDLLRPELRGCYAEEARAIRERHGRFILINTNFGATNSARRSPEVTRDWFIRTGRIDLDNPEDVRLLDGLFAMEWANREVLESVLRELPKRFPEHQFILRPHPIERTDVWDAFVRQQPRMHQVRDGAAAAWILASEAVLHTNCTTGVEAFALDVPAISIQPTRLPIYDIFLSNRINLVTADVEETLRVLQEVVGAGKNWAGYPPEFGKTFDHFFAGTRGAFASERVLEAIRDAFEPALAPDAPRPSWRPLAGYLPRTRTRKHHAMVMPDIDAAGIERILQGFRQALGGTERLQVEPCGQLLFHVHGARARAEHRLPSEMRARLRRLWPVARAAGSSA
jgi:surface carbohydrate biosynthesis protein